MCSKILKCISYGMLIAVHMAVYAQQSDRETMQAISKQYLQLIQSDDLDGVTALFHYPESYNAQERAKDIADIRRVQKVLFETFGKPQNTKIVERSIASQSFNFGIGGANPDYWNAHPEYYTVEYAVSFEHTGRGLIQIHLCKIKDTWEIRSILYDLPQSTAVARAAMSSFNSKMEKIRRTAVSSKD